MSAQYNFQAVFMETFFLHKLTHMINDAVQTCQVDWGDIGLLTATDKIWFMSQERTQLPEYFEVIRDKQVRQFEHDRTFIRVIPVIVSADCVGDPPQSGQNGQTGPISVRPAVSAEQLSHPYSAFAGTGR